MSLIGEHPPHPSSDRSTTIVVQNDVGRSADSQALACVSECLVSRQRVPARSARVGQIGIEINESGAGYVGLIVCGSPRGGVVDVPAAIDNHDVNVVKASSEFERRYQRVCHGTEATGSVG